MKKTIIEERTGWEYELIGEQYYPTGRMMRDGKLQPETVEADNEPEKDNGPGEGKQVGVWGQRHLNHIRQHNKPLYLELSLSGELNAYLVDINAQAEDFFSRLVKQMADQENVNETMKATDQILWVARMNNIRDRAIEIANRELIIT